MRPVITVGELRDLLSGAPADEPVLLGYNNGEGLTGRDLLRVERVYGATYLLSGGAR